MIELTPEVVLALAKTLTEREQDVLRSRVLPDESYIEIGKRLGINGPKVQAIEERAYRLLRLALGGEMDLCDEDIADYLRAGWMREKAGMLAIPTSREFSFSGPFVMDYRPLSEEEVAKLESAIMTTGKSNSAKGEAFQPTSPRSEFTAGLVGSDDPTARVLAAAWNPPPPKLDPFEVPTKPVAPVQC